MPPISESSNHAVEQVESILSGQAPTAVPASAYDADDLPEFLRAIDEPVTYGAHC